MYKNYKSVLALAGLPDIRFHDLRLTAASFMLNNHVPLNVVFKILGHASPSTTLNLYGHWVTEGQQEAVRVIEEIGAPIAVVLDSPKPIVNVKIPPAK